LAIRRKKEKGKGTKNEKKREGIRKRGKGKDKGMKKKRLCRNPLIRILHYIFICIIL